MFSVRKLGVPGYPELALGAVATGGVRVLNDDVLASVPDVDQDEVDAITERPRAAYGDPGRRRPGDRGDHARRGDGRAATRSGGRGCGAGGVLAIGGAAGARSGRRGDRLP